MKTIIILYTYNKFIIKEIFNQNPIKGGTPLIATNAPIKQHPQK